jgi:putative membrane protein
MKVSCKIIAIALLVANTILVGCDGDSDAGDAAGVEDTSDTAATTKNEAEDKNDSAMSTKTDEKEARFVVDVVASNYGEVKLARLAKQKASNSELKDLAGILEQDHSAVLGDLKSLASKKGITIPTEENGDSKDKLKELTDEKASTFDKEWCETLMDNHKTSITKFENAANDFSDPDIKSFVTSVLPKLRTHHDRLMECHKKLK